MPLLVAQRNTHQGVVVLDRCHSATSKKLFSEHPHHQQPLDFTMSKFKPSTRHQLYRQIYSAEDSLQYDQKMSDDQGKCFFKRPKTPTTTTINRTKVEIVNACTFSYFTFN